MITLEEITNRTVFSTDMVTISESLVEGMRPLFTGLPEDIFMRSLLLPLVISMLARQMQSLENAAISHVQEWWLGKKPPQIGDGVMLNIHVLGIERPCEHITHLRLSVAAWNQRNNKAGEGIFRIRVVKKDPTQS